MHAETKPTSQRLSPWDISRRVHRRAHDAWLKKASLSRQASAPSAADTKPEKLLHA